MGKAKNVSYDGTLIKFTSHVEKTVRSLILLAKEKQTEQKTAQLKSICIQRIWRKEKTQKILASFPGLTFWLVFDELFHFPLLQGVHDICEAPLAPLWGSQGCAGQGLYTLTPTFFCLQGWGRWVVRGKWRHHFIAINFLKGERNKMKHSFFFLKKWGEIDRKKGRTILCSLSSLLFVLVLKPLKK